MAIVALVVTLIPPLFSGAVPGARLKGAARDLAVAMRDTRSQAITRNAQTALHLNLEQAQYTIPGRQSRSLPAGVRVNVATAAGEDALPEPQHVLYFYPDGSSSGSRITLSSGKRAYRLDVDWLTGRVSIAEATQDDR